MHDMHITFYITAYTGNTKRIILLTIIIINKKNTRNYKLIDINCILLHLNFLDTYFAWHYTWERQFSIA